MTRLYHRTPAANEILRDGFHDTTGNYGFATLSLAGVWMSDVPLDINEGAKGDDLLEVSLPDDVDLSDFEVIEEAKPYREWCVPAELLNRSATVRAVTEE